ncbi:MAG: KEOPS complex subunit Pcc1 [Aigarchaeota archaeon]|nr:KEOPS complex subunit Pcc1 [Aigarchaeota archaeon]MDW8092452.1 KEOPS complex subunit Pcc1 [Nitrososphaerota archaeon]
MIRASLRISFCDQAEADIVARSIDPDNRPLPVGMDLRCERVGSDLIVEITSSRSIESLIYTIDDLLTSIKLAERIACRKI